MQLNPMQLNLFLAIRFMECEGALSTTQTRIQVRALPSTFHISSVDSRVRGNDECGFLPTLQQVELFAGRVKSHP